MSIFDNIKYLFYNQMYYSNRNFKKANNLWQIMVEYEVCIHQEHLFLKLVQNILKFLEEIVFL